MSYQTVLHELYALSARGISLGLARMQAASERIGSPHLELPAIQVAGTNGKGTACALLEAAFRAAGKKTALFTSPHLHRFAERMRIDGRELPDDEVAEALETVLSATSRATAPPLTFFEVTTLAALWLFARHRVDVAVLEVGLGGRLDATSVVVPRASVITSIGRDHTDLLGDTPALIAAEKAGIARPGVPLYCGLLDVDAMASVENVARRAGAPLLRMGEDFCGDGPLAFPLPGIHQRRNGALARRVFLDTAEGFGAPSDGDIFDRAAATVHMPARFELIDGQPPWLLDGAHNIEAVEALIETLREKGWPVHALIFGALRNKPAGAMIERLRPLAQRVIVATPPVPRGFDGAAFAAQWQASYAGSVAEALRMAAAGPGAGGNPATGVNLIAGSFFLAAEARRILLQIPSDPPMAL